MDENKPKWVDLFGIDPDYNKEALAEERAKLFEVFRAGYQAGMEDGTNRQGDRRTGPSRPAGHQWGSDVATAFEDWLAKQVSDVDVLGLRKGNE